MMQRITMWLAGTCIAVVATLLHAADDAKPAPQATTISDPNVRIDVLELRLKPLTKDELAVEAVAWRNLVKAKVAEVSAAEIAIKLDRDKTAESASAATPDSPARPETKKQILASLPGLRDEKTALIDRLSVVLTEWEAKAGDPAEYRKYLTAVGGLHVDLFDATSAWTAISGWATSEQGGVRWAWNFARFFLVLGGFYLLGRFLARAALRATLNARQMSGLLRAFITTSVLRVVLVLGFVIALSALEVNIGPLLAALGAVGFVAGFALQDTLSNFASGVMILAYRPFDIDDHVTVAATSGQVVSMNLVSTHLKTDDGKYLIIPNSKIWGGIITRTTTPKTDAPI